MQRRRASLPDTASRTFARPPQRTGILTADGSAGHPFDARLAQALSDRYVIERELGAGGMATVWLAHDVKHDRRVALKVLHPNLTALLGADRFLKEIHTTAQLQHPHILPLFDSGEADGSLFYVMPLVDGESLRQRITREQRLPVSDAVRIASEIASALDYAHRHGVIHRDIKPENILLHEGRALVGDFGIAIAPGSGEGRLTETGVSLGTPTYMSPEQALGERQLDARTDVYALGALLYEMLTGAPPFTGASAQAIVAKVITEKPVPVSKVRRDVPPHVADAILTALQKEPADRFPTAAAFEQALAGAGAASTRVNRGFRFTPIAATAVVLLVAVAGYFALHRGKGAAPPIALSIAALPFQIHDSADAYLGDQIPSEILDALTHVPGLTVRPLAFAARFRGGRDLSAIAGELHVGTLLTGSVEHEGGSLRVTARLYDVGRNVSLPAVSFTNRADNTFALEDSVSRTIVSGFRLTQTQADLNVARAGRTTSAAAHDTLMLAKWYAEQRTPHGLSAAITLFRTAIRLDSTYADAWAGLANALNLRAVFGDSSPALYFPDAKINVQHALELDSNSAYAHTTNGFVKVFYDRDYASAGKEFARAIALDSTQSSSFLFRSWYYLGTNRLDSAIASTRHAWKIDPAALIVGTRLGSLLYYADSLPQAEQQLNAVLKIDGEFRFAKSQLAQVYADDHQCEKALAEIPDAPFTAGTTEHPMIAYAWARCNQPAKAEQYLGTVEASAVHGRYVDAFAVATVFAALHDRAAVYRWLNKAVDDNDWALFQLRVHPAFREYRSEPEFQKLARRARMM
jgi:eukaryotic-like serine/threonine-protein kinase